MAHIVKQTDRCEIDIDTQAGFIFLQMKWTYTWAKLPAVSNWTLAEKRAFHTKLDKAIWKSWSNRAKLSVSGGATFARAFAARQIPINLDVKWATSDPHWQVTVTKIPAGDWAQSEVFWNDRKITLDSEDVNPAEKCVDVPHAGLTELWANLSDSTASIALIRDLLTTEVCRNQVVIEHEFGHAAGNTGVLSRGDEYRRSSPHVRDTDSMLNIGNQLRDRHFTTIIEDLNTMIPDCRFSVGTIRA